MTRTKTGPSVRLTSSSSSWCSGKAKEYSLPTLRELSSSYTCRGAIKWTSLNLQNLWGRCRTWSFLLCAFSKPWEMHLEAKRFGSVFNSFWMTGYSKIRMKCKNKCLSKGRNSRESKKMHSNSNSMRREARSGGMTTLNAKILWETPYAKWGSEGDAHLMEWSVWILNSFSRAE